MHNHYLIAYFALLLNILEYMDVLWYIIKMMKNFFMGLLAVALLFLIACIIIYPMLPAILPIHWVVYGTIANAVSKQSFFSIPIFLTILPIIFLLIDRDNTKNGTEYSSQKKWIVIISLSIGYALFIGLTIYYLLPYIAN